jgi:hypothetical protein
MNLTLIYNNAILMIMQTWSEWKKNIGETRPWHLLDPSKTVDDEKVVEKRMSICNSCPELIKSTKQCKKCGCFMSAKTTLKYAECPIGLWGKESND